MKRVFSSKQKRKQAEDDIIRNIELIHKNLKEHKDAKATTVDKTNTMSVVTKFLKLKSDGKLN